MKTSIVFVHNQLFRRFQILAHYGKRFINAPFPLSQILQSDIILRVANQMKTADSFDGDGFSVL